MQPVFLNCWQTSRSAASGWKIWAISVRGLSYHRCQHELWLICGQCILFHSSCMGLCFLAGDMKGKLRRQGSVWLCREGGMGQLESKSRCGYVPVKEAWFTFKGSTSVHVHQLLCPSSAVRADDMSPFIWWHWFSQLPLPLDQQKDGFNSRWMSFWNFNDVFSLIVWVKDISKLSLKKIC